MRLTIHEVSELLNLPVTTLRRWIRQGKIPVYSIKGKYVFLEKDLRKWAKSHHIVIASKLTESTAADSGQGATLLSAMKKGGVLCGISGKDVSGVLKAVVEAAPLDPSIDRRKLFLKLIEREELCTTGIGRGIAIPHPRSPLRNGPPGPSITTCFLHTPINFSAIDGLPVFVLFMMLSSSSHIHVRLLAKLSHMLRDASFLNFLRDKPSARDLLSRVGQMETKMDSADRTSRRNHAS